MEKEKEVNYRIEAMEKLPEKWSYIHEILKVYIKGVNNDDISIDMYYIPCLLYTSPSPRD